MEKNVSPEIYVFSDTWSIAENLSEDLQKQALKSEKKITVALSGGSTPRVFFQCLVSPPFQNKILWKKIHFFWGDERCVPPDHEDSNYRMTREMLLDHISIPAENIHRIQGEAPPATEADRYTIEISNHLEISEKGWPVFDWIILGMGTDGHTASLFPESSVLQEQKEFCVTAEHPETGQPRISLTLPVINHARRVSFLVTGAKKAALVARIIKEEGVFDFPAARVQPAGRLEWYLDETAASLL